MIRTRSDFPLRYSPEGKKRTRRPERQFRFNRAEIYGQYPDKGDWLRHVRWREFEAAQIKLDGRKFQRALEIGSGTGIQAEWLAEFCDELFCSDVSRKRWDSRPNRTIPANTSFLTLDATDLSRFPDQYFDLVWSSNVLEHVEAIGQCLAETHRVLRPSGIGVHSMPSRYWKFVRSMYTLSRLRRPRVHGVETGNFREFLAYGLDVWCQEFESAGFDVTQIYGMPFYHGLGLRWRPVILAGNHLGLPSSHTFFVQRKSQ